jgi:hypothetical protein
VNHNIPARSQATRTESATASTGGTTRGRSRNHHNYSPPRDKHHPRRQEDTCGVSALTPRLRAIQCPPNFKVSNVDKYEPKQDQGGWLAVYTTAARAAGASEDVMTAYLPIVLGQDALQCLRHLPRHYIDDWSDFSRRFTANFQSLSDKPAQPWDLKSIKRQGDETLRSYLKRFQTQRLGLCLSHITEGANYLRTTVPGSRPLQHRRRASSRPQWRNEACASSTTTQYEPATRQTLGEEASRGSARRRTTCLSRPRRTSRRQTHAG